MDNKDEKRWPFGAPGSPVAVNAGCKCARIDNHHGKGAFGEGEHKAWWISGDCPLHSEHN